MWTGRCYQASVLFRAEEEESEFLVRKWLFLLRGRGGGKGHLCSDEDKGRGPLLRSWGGQMLHLGPSLWEVVSPPQGVFIVPPKKVPCARLGMPCRAAGLQCPWVERFCSSSLHSGEGWGGRCCCSLLGELAVLGGIHGLQGDLVYHFSHLEPSFLSAFWVVEV